MAVNNFDNLISWSDFMPVAVRPPGSNEDAEIIVKFPQSYDYSLGKKTAIITNLTVDIIMASPECWVLNSQAKNMDLLKHEQGHYDITALGAREFHAGLTGMSAANEEALKKKIRKLRDSVQAKINRANLNYDNQTNHGLKTPLQQTWNKEIDTAKKNPKGVVNDLP